MYSNRYKSYCGTAWTKGGPLILQMGLVVVRVHGASPFAGIRIAEGRLATVVAKPAKGAAESAGILITGGPFAGIRIAVGLAASVVAKPANRSSEIVIPAKNTPEFVKIRIAEGWEPSVVAKPANRPE